MEPTQDLTLLLLSTAGDKHSLKFFFTGSSAVQNVSEFVGVVMVDGVEVFYCDSNKRAEPKQDWMRELMHDHPEHRDWYTDECNFTQHLFNELILQRMCGCEWDTEVHTFDKYGYKEKDFLEFNLETGTWIPSAQEQALSTTTEWNKDKIKSIRGHLNKSCVEWLGMYLSYGNSTLLRKVNHRLKTLLPKNRTHLGEFFMKHLTPQGKHFL
uniref:MHC class I-like antigen recognition-like domain-containing protein n=1 Tax=Lates calcarifer TaxID=8187 RepID=A0A4W6FKI1_LATCA